MRAITPTGQKKDQAIEPSNGGLSIQIPSSHVTPIDMPVEVSSPVTPTPRLVDFALAFLLYFLGAKLGAVFTTMPEGMAILWPPNAVILAALILFQGRRFLVFAALALCAEIIVDLGIFSWTEALLFGLTNVTEAAIGFALLRRWRFHPRFDAPSDVLKFLTAGPLIAALVAACFGAAIYSQFRGEETKYVEFFRVWWFGDGLGLLIFTPLLLSFWPLPREKAPNVAELNKVDALLLLIFGVALGLLTLTREGRLHGVHLSPVLLSPLLLFLAVRFQFRWVALAVAIVALATVIVTTRKHYPFGSLPPRDELILVQEFIFIMSVMALGLSVLISELRTKQAALENNNKRLNDLNRTLDSKVKERTVELVALNEQLAQLALTDHLTGVLNRRGLFDAAKREIDRARRHDKPLAMIMFDIDHFKAINDKYGHDFGDEALRCTVATIRSVARTTDTLARYGGEEFVILAPETSRQEARMLAERMRQALRSQEMENKSGLVKITASFGIALLDEGNDFDDLLTHADKRLYVAKHSGRDCIVASGADRKNNHAAK